MQFDGDAAADLTNRYLWAGAVDQILADEQVTTLSSAGDVYWPLTDHQGTVRQLAFYDSGSGDTTIQRYWEYDSFGNVTSETAAAVDHLFGYTGRAFDDETGLQNNLHRWYDPVVGRWASEDPIGFAAGDANLYRYVGNGPTNGVDPTGLEGWMTTAWRSTRAAAGAVRDKLDSHRRQVGEWLEDPPEWAERANRRGMMSAVPGGQLFVYMGAADTSLHEYLTAAGVSDNPRRTQLGSRYLRTMAEICDTGGLSAAGGLYKGGVAHAGYMADMTETYMNGELGLDRQGAYYIGIVDNSSLMNVPAQGESLLVDISMATAELVTGQQISDAEIAAAEARAMQYGLLRAKPAQNKMRRFGTWLNAASHERGNDAAPMVEFVADMAMGGAFMGRSSIGRRVSGQCPYPRGGAPVRGASDYVDLASPQRRRHILDGDATGGGHRPGTGNPGKSEFPVGWSDDRIMHEISDVATDPSLTPRPGRGGRTIVEGTRDGIDIRVIQEANGDIVTGYPTNVPRNP